jgi:hypothetical protein
MKKITFMLAAVLLTVFSTNAQITLTASDFPGTGTYFINVVDTLCLNVSKGNAGANQTWNLANIGNSYSDTSYWANPATLAGFSYFPTATIGNHSTSGQNTFIKSSSTAFEMLGFYGDGGSGLGTQASVFNPSYKYIQIPSTYQTTYTGTYNFEMKIAYPQPPIDSMKMSFAVNYTTLVDGWGTVTTPIYSNVACLRQKIYTVATISASLHMSGIWVPTGTTSQDTSINYVFLSNTKKNTIADLTVQPSGFVSQASYLKYEGTGTGINESYQNMSKVQLYPNPANDNITINGLAETAVLLVFDVNGKLISNNLLKNSRNTINVSQYAKGLYVYQIYNLKGNLLDNGKLSIVR